MACQAGIHVALCIVVFEQPVCFCIWQVSWGSQVAAAAGAEAAAAVAGPAAEHAAALSLSLAEEQALLAPRTKPPPQCLWRSQINNREAEPPRGTDRFCFTLRRILNGKSVRCAASMP